MQARLIDGAEGTTNGSWIDTNGRTTGTVEVTGITTATVQIRGSNARTKPDDTDHGSQIGSDVSSDDLVALSEIPVRWIKARVSAHTTGTIIADLMMQ